MDKPPAFQFYPNDFATGCSLMSPAEVGCYILMLCHQWDHGFLPSDASALQMLCRSSEPISSKVMVKFEVSEDGNLRNARLEKTRSTQDAYRTRITAVRKDAAMKRWADANAHPKAKQVQSTSNAFKETGVGVEEKTVRKDHPRDPPPFESPDFLQALSDFEDMRVKIKKPLTPAARRMIFSKLQAMGEPAAIASLHNSTISDWPGVYPPKPDRPLGSTPQQPEHNAGRRTLKTTFD